jgi:hypothetical protein
VIPALTRLAGEYGSRISIEIFGDHRAPSLKDDDLPFRTIPMPADIAYPEAVEWLKRRSAWDIGLLPLVDNAPNNHRSPVKFLEYSALGVASICSNLDPCSELVHNENNGLLVKNDADEWYQAIKRLVDDRELRIALATEALQSLRSRDTSVHRVDTIIEMFEAATKRPYKAPPVEQTPEKKEVKPAPPSKQVRSEIPPAPLRSLAEINLRELVRDPESFVRDFRIGRKLKKLVREPVSFVEDSKFFPWPGRVRRK